MINTCSVYGLGIKVDRPIGGLAGLAAPQSVDVQVSLGSMPPLAGAIPVDAWREYFVSPDLEDGVASIKVCQSPMGEFFRVAYADGTVIVIDAPGKNVWATWPGSATVEDTATYLLGPALGFVLRLRGIMSLHASAIAIDGRALAFVGPSGSGKSTMAAAFACLGRAVMTDDVLALVENEAGFEAQPAYPRVRLWPQSVEGLFGSENTLPRITPGWDKRFLHLDGQRFRFQHEAVPLAAIYFLDECSADSQQPCIEPVGRQDGLMSLVANTSANYLLDKPKRAAEFEALGRLLESVPLRRLKLNDDFNELPLACELVVADFLHMLSAYA